MYVYIHTFVFGRIFVWVLVTPRMHITLRYLPSRFGANGVHSLYNNDYTRNIFKYKTHACACVIEIKLELVCCKESSRTGHTTDNVPVCQSTTTIYTYAGIQTWPILVLNLCGKFSCLIWIILEVKNQWWCFNIEILVGRTCISNKGGPACADVFQRTHGFQTIWNYLGTDS